MHPLHKCEKTKLTKLKKVTADISEIIYQETGIVISVASRKNSKLLLFTDNRPYAPPGAQRIDDGDDDDENRSVFY